MTSHKMPVDNHGDEDVEDVEDVDNACDLEVEQEPLPLMLGTARLSSNTGDIISTHESGLAPERIPKRCCFITQGDSSGMNRICWWWLPFFCLTLFAALLYGLLPTTSPPFTSPSFNATKFRNSIKTPPPSTGLIVPSGPGIQSRTTIKGPYAGTGEGSCLLKKPKVLIIVSDGRSGSTVLATVLSKLTKSTTLSFELPGSNTKNQQRFFKKSSLKKIETYLCTQQRKHPESHFVGFKWKPYFLEGAEIHKALEWVASQDAKLIHSTRNALDKLISQERHRQYTAPAHCHSSECAANALEQTVKLDCATTLNKLREMAAGRRHVEELFQSVQSYHAVTYEELFSKVPRVEAWKKMLTFLGEPSDDLTEDALKSAEHSVATSASTQSKKVDNYSELVQCLKDTEFATLLH